MFRSEVNIARKRQIPRHNNFQRHEGGDMVEAVVEAQQIREALAILRNRLDELYGVAESLGKRHLDFVMAENKKKSWEERSILFMKARTRDNTLAASWYEIHWYGSKALKTRRMTKKVIVKPRNNYGYSMNVLLKFAQPWEADLVSGVEQALIPLRREASFIAKAIAQLNHVIKIERSGESQ
jgi:hypothetical protein